MHSKHGNDLNVVAREDFSKESLIVLMAKAMLSGLGTFGTKQQLSARLRAVAPFEQSWFITLSEWKDGSSSPEWWELKGEDDAVLVQWTFLQEATPQILHARIFHLLKQRRFSVSFGTGSTHAASFSGVTEPIHAYDWDNMKQSPNHSRGFHLTWDAATALAVKGDAYWGPHIHLAYKFW